MSKLWNGYNINLFQGGLASRQDCSQFEDALRRLYALELKLTDQVSFVICFITL